MFHFEASVDYQQFEPETGKKAQQASIEYQHFELKIGQKLNEQQIT